MHTSAAIDELLDAAAPRPGDRVLNVTAGPTSSEAGWPLPFDDASFDVVICRRPLQLFPDRGQVLSELRRVLVPGGRAAVSVWGPIERGPAFSALATALERHGGTWLAAAMHWRFSLSQPGDLRAVLADSDLEPIRMHTVSLARSYGSVNEFVRSSVPAITAGWTTACFADRRRVVADLEKELRPWIDGDGRLWVTKEVVIGVARRW